MGLPDRDSASTWGGKLLVDRDGTEIGTCTQIFLDDATGQPEWAQADLSSGPGVVPLMDAAPAGDRVKVAVRRAEVEDAPRVDDPLHISQDEEERLYRHYGITFSREDSDSLLPVDGPVAAEPGLAEPALAEPALVEPTPAEPVLAAPVAAEPGPADTGAPATTEATSPVTTDVTTDLTDSGDSQRRGLLPALAAGAVGVLAVIAAAVFWWRRQHQLPPTRKELLAERARAASLALAAKRDQLSASAAPLVLTGRRVSAAAAQSAAPLVLTGRRVSAAAAQQAAVQARVAAERAAVQARAAAQQAAAVAAAARTVRLQRVAQEADIEQQMTSSPDRRQRRDAVMTALEAFGGFAAGYAVRARAGRSSSERLEQAGSPGRGQQVQRIAGRVQTRVTDTVRAGNAQLSQRGSALAGRVRRGSTDDRETL